MSEENANGFPDITTPPWQSGTRLVFAVLLMILAAAVLIGLRQLIGPVVLAFLLAYVLHPLVVRLEKLTGMSRGAAVLSVYGLLLLLLAGATTGAGLAISQQIVALVADLTQLSTQLPARLRQLSEMSIQLGPWTIDLAQANLDPLLNSLASSLQPLLSQTGSLLASAVSATATTVGMLLLVLVFGYYVLRDFGQLDDVFLGLVPDIYRPDFERLLDETGRVWQSFLRGQLILALVMGVGTWLIFSAIGLRFALGLGLIAGMMEFVPIFGPIIAGLLAVLVALFQASNFWGLSPLAFGLTVLAIATVIQQIENNVLVPRIIGHSLNLHPLIVLLAALSGGILAGVLGVLLAAPTVATLRLWLGYMYRKTVRLHSWPAPVIDAAEPDRQSWVGRVRGWLGDRIAGRRRLEDVLGEGDSKDLREG